MSTLQAFSSLFARGMLAHLRKGFDPRRIMAREMAFAGLFSPANRPQPDQPILTEQELRSGIVFRVIDVIAEDCASVPIRLKRRKANGESELVEDDHPFYRTFRWVNDSSTPHTFWAQLYADLDSEGNSFTHVRKVMGLPATLTRLPPEEMTPVPAAKGTGRLIASYLWEHGIEKTTIPVDEVWQVRTRSPMSEVRGLGRLMRMRFEIRLMERIDDWNFNRFDKNIPTQVVIAYRGKFQAGDRERIEQMLRDKQERGDQWMLIEGNQQGQAEFDIKNWPRATNEEVGLLEQKRFIIAQFLATHGVPPSKVMIFDDAFKANAGEQERVYWEDTVKSRHRLVADSINSSFLPRFFPDEPDLFVEFDYNDVRALQQSAKEKAEIAEINVRSGMWSPNEGRVFQGGEADATRPELDDHYFNGRLVGQDPLIGLDQFGVAPAQNGNDKPKPKPEKVDPDKQLALDFDGIEKLLSEISAKARNGRKKPIVLTDLLDLDAERAAFERAVRKKIERIVQRAGDQFLDLSGVVGSFNVTVPQVVEYIGQMVMFMRQAAVDNRNEAARAALAQGYDEGATPAEMRELIRQAFKDGRERWQLERIARTEIHTAQEGGNYLAAHQNGVEMKRWITARDSRVRGLEQNPQADHDGIETAGPVNLSSPFKDPVSGSSLLFPGDRSMGAGPQDTINCRCSWIAHFDDPAKDFEIDVDRVWKERDREFERVVTDTVRFLSKWIAGLEERALAAFDEAFAETGGR